MTEGASSEPNALKHNVDLKRRECENKEPKGNEPIEAPLASMGAKDVLHPDDVDGTVRSAEPPVPNLVSCPG